MPLAHLLVRTYFFAHGKLHVRGAGWLIRRAMRFMPALRAYPQRIPGAGTAILDFQDNATYDVLNVLMGDPGPNRHVFPWLERLLWPGQVVWDVGANVGYFSLHLSRIQPDLKAIHAFEPNPKALKTLGSIFDHHHMVKVHPFGLASKDETLEMQCPDSATPYGTLARELPNAVRFPVPLRHGDTYRLEAGIDLPDVIKIDVEGFEPSVFEGLAQTLAKARPIVLFEHCWLTDEQLAEIQRNLPSRYEILFLLKEGGSTTDSAHRMEGDDAILYPGERATLIENCRAELESVVEHRPLPDKRKLKLM